MRQLPYLPLDLANAGERRYREGGRSGICGICSCYNVE